MAGRSHRIEPYLQRLYRYGFSLARDDDLAGELVQECVVKALGAKRTPDDEPAYRAWLFRILRNAFLDRARRARTAASFLDPRPVPDDHVEYWDGDERLINGLDVRRQMERLPAHYREILALIDLAGLSYAETAEILVVPVGTVMSRVSRARRALLEGIGETNVRPFAPVRKRSSS
jgi:RNA polymerase sigma-70 factor (ECF subfamily)